MTRKPVIPFQVPMAECNNGERGPDTKWEDFPPWRRAAARYGTNPPSLCKHCGAVLHSLLRELGYATHPCCDPGEEPWDWTRDG